MIQLILIKMRPVFHWIIANGKLLPKLHSFETEKTVILKFHQNSLEKIIRMASIIYPWCKSNSNRQKNKWNICFIHFVQDIKSRTLCCSQYNVIGKNQQASSKRGLELLSLLPYLLSELVDTSAQIPQVFTSVTVSLPEDLLKSFFCEDEHWHERLQVVLLWRVYLCV